MLPCFLTLFSFLTLLFAVTFCSAGDQCLFKITRRARSRGVPVGFVFPVVVSGQVYELQPTHSIKRCETHSENVSHNQWKQGSALSNLASNRLQDQSEYLALAKPHCNLCTHEARSTTAQKNTHIHTHAKATHTYYKIKITLNEWIFHQTWLEHIGLVWTVFIGSNQAVHRAEMNVH